MIQNKIYSCTLQAVVAPGVLWANSFFLTYLRHNFRIKSIGWDYRMINSVTDEVLPIDTQNVFHVMLHIGRGTADMPKVTDCFNGFAVPPVGFNGSRVTIFKPKQLQFDSWFVNEQIEFLIEAENNDLLNTYNFRCSTFVEIQSIHGFN